MRDDDWRAVCSRMSTVQTAAFAGEGGQLNNTTISYAGALESKQISWLEGKLEQEKQIQLRAKSKPTPAQPNPPSLVLPPISKNRLMENSEETRRVIGEFQRSQVTTNDLLVQMLQIMKGNTQHQETVQGDLIDLAEPVTGQREKPSIINDVNVNKRVKIVDTRQGVVVESASRQQETVVNTSNNDSQRDETEHMREDWDDPTGYNQSSSGNTSNRDKEDGVKSC